MLPSVEVKSKVQELSLSQPPFLMIPGLLLNRTHDSFPLGTTIWSAAWNVADGSTIASTHRRHPATEFRKFPAKNGKEVPADQDFQVG